MVGTSGSGPQDASPRSHFCRLVVLWFRTFNNRIQDLIALQDGVDAACRGRSEGSRTPDGGREGRKPRGTLPFDHVDRSDYLQS